LQERLNASDARKIESKEVILALLKDFKSKFIKESEHISISEKWFA